MYSCTMYDQRSVAYTNKNILFVSHVVYQSRTIRIIHEYTERYGGYNIFFTDSVGLHIIWIYFILLQQNIITLLLALLYLMSCSMPYAEHTDNYKDKPIAEGDRSTKSSAYIIWLINVAPIVQPTFISFSLLLRSSM